MSVIKVFLILVLSLSLSPVFNCALWAAEREDFGIRQSFR